MKASVHDVVDFLANASDEEFAEVFVRLQIIRNNQSLIASESLNIRAEDMMIDIEDLCLYIQTSLNEIIYSKEIDSLAWWKQKKG